MSNVECGMRNWIGRRDVREMPGSELEAYEDEQAEARKKRLKVDR